MRWLHNVLQRGQRRAARRKGNGCVSGFLIWKQWHCLLWKNQIFVKIRFSNKELSECEILCRDDTGSLGFQCRFDISILNPELSCFFATAQFCLFDWLAWIYKQTSYMLGALCIVRDASNHDYLLLSLQLMRPAQGQQVQQVHKFKSFHHLFFRSFRHNSAQQECVLSSDDSDSLPDGLVTSPVHSFYQMVNILSQALNRNPDIKTYLGVHRRRATRGSGRKDRRWWSWAELPLWKRRQVHVYSLPTKKISHDCNGMTHSPFPGTTRRRCPSNVTGSL